MTRIALSRIADIRAFIEAAEEDEYLTRSRLSETTGSRAERLGGRAGDRDREAALTAKAGTKEE